MMNTICSSVVGMGLRRAAACAMAGVCLSVLTACGDNDSESAPPAPASLSAVAASPEVLLNWPSSEGATSYNLYWANTSGVTPATGTRIEGVSAPHLHADLLRGSTYHYVVTALNQFGESGPSPQASVTIAPAAPETVSATPGDTQVTIDWRDVPGATSYRIYWSNAAGVTPASGTVISNATAPFIHTGLTNGLPYYYVITAVNQGGESDASQQVSATPQVPPPSAPQTISALATPETTLSVTIQWTPPALPQGSEPVVRYNLYRSTLPGIAGDLSIATRVEDVVSPHIDKVPAGQVTYYYVVTAVTAGGEGAPSAEVSATPKGPPSGSGGAGGSGGDAAYGNNLSLPLVFADGLGLGGAALTGTDYRDLATGLRPTSTDVTEPFPYLDDGDLYVLNGTAYYRQQTASTWQASWINGSGALQRVEADWGDNLVSASLSSNQVVRVETVLRQYPNTPAWPAEEVLSAYPMALLYGSGRTEMQGTTGETVEAQERRVFTVTARLQIRKLIDGVPVDHPCGFDGSVAEGLAVPDGGGVARYSAEINVGGSQTYGFNWRLNQCTEPDKAGAWRISFSLDEAVEVNGQGHANNVLIDSLHPSESTAILESPRRTSIDVLIR
ncbi:MAG: hypothetical protein RL322_3185 [Pseudomonadota bacterium]|jgi:fibronectin type 3 domain-containing protein